MRSNVLRWGLSALTMASLATVLLLVTGWGSAVAASVSSVLVTNSASNPAQVHEAGTANVNVTNTTAMPVNAKNLNTDTNGNLKVAEQGTPTVHVNNTDGNGNLKVAEQNFPSSQTVNGSVSVSNLPAAATTESIAIGGPFFFPGDAANLFSGVQDVSAYREVTLYLNLLDPAIPPPQAPLSPGLHCKASTQIVVPKPGSGTGPSLTFDEFDTGTATNVTKTYDPAPPNIQISCTNNSSDPIIMDFMLTARTG
jgi:guanyl-specific ribonuclease Sa